MNCSIDLRYGAPPLISLLLLSSNRGGLLETDHHSTLMMILLLLAIAILFFLFTSIKLLLNVSNQPIRLRVGDFSGAVTILLIASFIFPPPLFWVAYPLIICLYPWYGLLLNLFKHFLCWLYHTLQAIPTLIISCITHQHEIPEPEPPQVEIDVLDVEGQTAMQDQPSLEVGFIVINVDEQLQ